MLNSDGAVLNAPVPAAAPCWQAAGACTGHASTHGMYAQGQPEHDRLIGGYLQVLEVESMVGEGWLERTA